MAEIVQLVSVLAIGLGFGGIATFAALWLLLKDLLLIPLKNIFSFNKAQFLHGFFRTEDGTWEQKYVKKNEVTHKGIFGPWDKDKKYPISYVKHNDRNSINMPMFFAFQGLGYTPEIGERYEQSVDEKGNLVYEAEIMQNSGEVKRVEVSLTPNEKPPKQIRPKMVKVAGLGVSNKKLSELNAANVVVSHMLGKASAIQELYDDIKQSPYLLPAIAITAILVVVVGVMVYQMYQGQMELLKEYQAYKPVIEQAIQQSSIEAG